MDEQNTNQNVPVNETGNSKKTIYIVIGIIVVVVLASFLMRSRTTIAPGLEVERGLDGQPTYTYETEDGTATWGTNKLPDNWPSDLPVYKNATVQFSGTSNEQNGNGGMAVIFETNDSVASVQNFYQTEFAKNGWTVTQNMVLSNTTIVVAEKDARTVGVNIASSASGAVTFTVALNLQ